jgi:uncharacterized protein YecE (DUF72 family)
VTTPEGRLRFFAKHFDTVEVDSTYYAIPAERNAGLWVQRTPAGFVFHVKAYSMLTGHPTQIKALPARLRDELPTSIQKKLYEKHFPKPLVDAAFDMFRTALNPLKATGKLGCLLFQFPPWFVPSAGAYRWMEMVRNRFPGYNLAVEFRNVGWLTPSEKEKSLEFLKDNSMSYVIVDAPWIKAWHGPVGVTAPMAYLRLHGRNRKNWFKRGVETVERYRYLYGEEELAAWADRTRQALGHAKQVFVIFNNCFEDYGIRNAKTFKGLLEP